MDPSKIKLGLFCSSNEKYPPSPFPEKAIKSDIQINKKN